jgi:hypothetical protein
MMKRTVFLLTAIAVGGAGACDREPTSNSAAAVPPHAASYQRTAPSVAQDLATLRRVTAPFHQFESATAAGWSVQITPCMTDPSAGGMGFHYGNVGLIDGSVQVDQPELLLYEPEKNGRLRLLAVEYIIPYTFHARSAEPPVLFGQEFKQNDTFQLWGLHAWVWDENPNGMFASWNPRVTCDNAPGAVTMKH